MKKIDFTKCERIIESGQIHDEWGNKSMIVHLIESGNITGESIPSKYEVTSAVILFFKDVFNNMNLLGDFVNYGINPFPVSFAKASQHNILEFKQFNNRCDFEQRLNLLKKEYYDLMKEYLNL